MYVSPATFHWAQRNYFELFESLPSIEFHWKFNYSVNLSVASRDAVFGERLPESSRTVRSAAPVRGIICTDRQAIRRVFTGNLRDKSLAILYVNQDFDFLSIKPDVTILENTLRILDDRRNQWSVSFVPPHGEPSHSLYLGDKALLQNFVLEWINHGQPW